MAASLKQGKKIVRLGRASATTAFYRADVDFPAMKIALGSDHAGFAYKERIKAMLLEMGHEVKDCGTFSADMVDYPLYVRPAAEAVARAASACAASSSVARETAKPSSRTR